MSNYYFYCPNCGKEEDVNILPYGTVGNIRDGYGTPIHHFECPDCHNLDAGYMRLGLCKMDELPDAEQKKYFREVIKMYQGIRGIKEGG